MKTLKTKLFSNAIEENERCLLSFTGGDPSSILLDLGCDNGNWTYQLIKALNPDITIGVDIVEKTLIKAKKIIQPVLSDLNKPLPFKSDSIGIIHANQVIEHLVDVDQFVEEIWRVLRPGGYVIISTENLSSWHNIFALLLGKQAFSQHISARVNIGNSTSLHYREKIDSEWAHIKVFAYYGLYELFEYYKFKDIQISGAGYYPFWGMFSRWMSRLDPRHTAFITLKAFKSR